MKVKELIQYLNSLNGESEVKVVEVFVSEQEPIFYYAEYSPIDIGSNTAVIGNTLYLGDTLN